MSEVNLEQKPVEVAGQQDEDVKSQWSKATPHQRAIIFILYCGLVGAVASGVVATSAAAGGAAIGFVAGVFAIVATSLDKALHS